MPARFRKMIGVYPHATTRKLQSTPNMVSLPPTLPGGCSRVPTASSGGQAWEGMWAQVSQAPGDPPCPGGWAEVLEQAAGKPRGKGCPEQGHPCQLSSKWGLSRREGTALNGY